MTATPFRDALAAQVDAFVVEHGLTKRDDQVWSGEWRSGVVVNVQAVAAPPGLGARYEQTLHYLYVALLATAEEHEPHQIESGADKCRHCGHTRSEGSVEICPTDTQCDDVGDQYYELRRGIFKPEEAAAWLADIGPALLEWGYDSASEHSPGHAIADALDFDALERLFPNTAPYPVDPATTKPEAY